MNLKMNGMYMHYLDCLKLQIVVDQGFLTDDVAAKNTVFPCCDSVALDL